MTDDPIDFMEVWHDILYHLNNYEVEFVINVHKLPETDAYIQKKLRQFSMTSISEMAIYVYNRKAHVMVAEPKKTLHEKLIKTEDTCQKQ